jgi:hypothetical protein
MSDSRFHLRESPRLAPPEQGHHIPHHDADGTVVGDGYISDTYALGVLAETTGLGVPTVVLPFVNTALASRAPFRRSVDSLRAEGVRILLGPGGFQPHPPRTGGNLIEIYPWHLGLDEAERMLDPATQRP